MKHISLFIIFFLFSNLAFSQTNWSDFAQNINPSLLKKHIYKLASDEYEGRKAGTKGQHLAAEYIRQEFEKYGLKKGNQDSYYQSFHLMNNPEDGQQASIWKGFSSFAYERDFYTKYPFKFSKQKMSSVFIGFGIETATYSDYENVDLQGKVAVMFVGTPDTSLQDNLYSNHHKLSLAKKAGAKAVIFLHDIDKDYHKAKTRTELISQFGFSAKIINFNEAETKPFPVFYFKKRAGQKLLNKTLSKLKPKLIADFQNKTKTYKNYFNQIVIQTKIFSQPTQNVIGILEGTSKKEEYIVVTAHYDHLGKLRRDIFNGADDNASGVSTMLELARVFSEAAKNGKRLERSIIFIAFTAEEVGLVGSEYFMKNPVVPVEKMVFNFNMDMVGRAKKRKGKYNLFVITSDTDANKFNEQVVKEYSPGIIINQELNSKNHSSQSFYRSDHYSFYKRKIPFIKYHSGSHKDYHKSTDTANQINYDGLFDISKLSFWLLLKLSEAA